MSNKSKTTTRIVDSISGLLRFLRAQCARTLQLERSWLTSLTRASFGLFQLGETFHAAKAQRRNTRKPAQKILS